MKKLFIVFAFLVLVGAGCSSQSDSIVDLELETRLHSSNIDAIYERIAELEARVDQNEYEMIDVRDIAERAERDSSNLCGELDIC